MQTIATDNVERVARGFKIVPYGMPGGRCASYYPETNGLVPLYSRDEVSHTPSYKAVRVRILRSESGVTSQRRPE